MRTEQHIDVLRAEGRLMADAAADADPDVAIPTCPGWTMRDLLHHTGGIHRWATGYVAGRRTEEWPVDLVDVVGAWPPDDQLVDWFCKGVEALLAVLVAAPDDVDWYTFLRAPTARAMWARRQAHETTVHRVDAESPGGGARSPIDAHFAADGVDELLTGFMGRPRRGLDVDAVRTLQVVADDTGDAWHVRIEADRMRTSSERAPAETTLTGTAAGLYLLLWNRGQGREVDVAGNDELLAWWRDQVQVRWGGAARKNARER
jgi:uncharacterized protein (TIGR03083 family)